MNVSIITEGFQSTGYGHITRSLALYQAFEERDIYPTLFINGDENARSFLANANYKMLNWLNRPTQLIGDIKNSDILIIDSYLAGKEFYENISALSNISLFVDDNLRLDYPDGIILNGTINAEAFPYQKKSGSDYLLGAKYIPLRKEFLNIPTRKINQSLNSVLITFGGQDNKNITLPTLKALHESFPNIKKKVVIGGGFKNKEDIEKLRNNTVEVHIAPNAKLMYELMISCDITISASGQTLYELAATGSPTIAIAVAENQKNNILEWKKKGFLLEPIFHGDVNFLRRLIEQIETLQSISNRKKLSRVGKENVDGQGSRRVVSFIFDKYCSDLGFYIRKAVENDSKRVFNLSNDPTVRQQSISRKSIEWDHHQSWFSQKIKDENYIFLLAFDKKDNLIGQVRFEVENDFTVVSISISHDFRGKGLSKKILKEACSKVFSEKNNVKKIIAYIRPDNVASIKGFESTDFNFSAKKIINEEIFLCYVLNRE